MKRFFVALLASAVPVLTFAQGSSPGEFVTQIFNFAMTLGGILAFGMLIYGGVKYMVAAGNPSSQSDARDQITQALLGLLLLIGGIFILNVINPDIPKATFGTLGKLNEIQDPVTGTQCPSTCAVGQGCVQDPETGNKSCQPCPAAIADSCAVQGPDVRCVAINNVFTCAPPCGPDRGGYCNNPEEECLFQAGLASPYYCGDPSGAPLPAS